eukprot:2040330-Pleurochrysis_carterae.AAC.1
MRYNGGTQCDKTAALNATKRRHSMRQNAALNAMKRRHSMRYNGDTQCDETAALNAMKRRHSMRTESMMSASSSAVHPCFRCETRAKTARCARTRRGWTDTGGQGIGSEGEARKSTSGGGAQVESREWNGEGWPEQEESIDVKAQTGIAQVTRRNQNDVGGNA